MRDPRDIWLSDNFRLSDFLGNHSVYARGFANPFCVSEDSLQIANAQALCESGLEPLLAKYGPLTIAYGYISPTFSQRTVKYQDPDKASHHRWDLGAAADVCVHNWVEGGPLAEPDMAQLFMDANARTSPIALAHAIHASGAPYSRLITYSESPYLCLAVSAVEVAKDQPRKAFYENRYQNQPRQKPEYIQLASEAAKHRAVSRLQQQGLEHDWRGGGFPSYHGGGIQQYQHVRVSQYTMLIDWLFSLTSISNGAKNTPPMLNEPFLDAVAACGLTFDRLVQSLSAARLSILSGFLCRSHPDFDQGNDWRDHTGFVSFEVGAPRDTDPGAFAYDVLQTLPEGCDAEETERGARVTVDVESVLSTANSL